MPNSTRAFIKSTLPAAVAAASVALTTPALAQLQLEEVIVTAQKREQTLQDVPGSVAAMTQETLEKTVTNNFEDLNKITSGINIQGGADGFGKVVAGDHVADDGPHAYLHRSFPV